MPPAQVRIVDFAETKIAVLEHRGDPRTIGASIERFVAWRKQNHLPPSTNATFNLIYCDPATVAPADFRLDIGVATDQPVTANTAGISGKTIPGGRCAVLRHCGSEDELGKAIAQLCGEWLLHSGEARRDAPVFLQRVHFAPFVPEDEAVTDVFLPLR